MSLIKFVFNHFACSGSAAKGLIVTGMCGDKSNAVTSDPKGLQVTRSTEMG